LLGICLDHVIGENLLSAMSVSGKV
jgi:hypothetical protein